MVIMTMTWNGRCRLCLVASMLSLMIIMHSAIDKAVLVSGAPQVPAMFVFGDSLVDTGNNNYINSIAKSDYYPYGCDFNRGPSGRFSNGKTIIDMFGELLGGVPMPSAFADPYTRGAKIFSGVNYASAAAGILDDTGKHYGDRYTLSQQVQYFQSTVSQMRTMSNGTNLDRYLAKSIAVMVFGSNDYINNYLMPADIYPDSHGYSPDDFAKLLLNHYIRQILALHSMGLRKFVLAGIGPLGCIPNQLATGKAAPGRCVDYVNQMLGTYNEGLRSYVNLLNSNYPDAKFVYGNTYGAVGDMLNNPAIYGFSVVNRGCCGLGRNQGQITCLPFAVPCPDRNDYVFWDAYHPTQAATTILAQRAFFGPPNDCFPINVQQLALI